MDRMLPPQGVQAYGPADKDRRPCFDDRPGSVGRMDAERGTLRRPVPGPLFRLVKWTSWFESGLFTALLFFWLAPGFEHETFIFGLSHGIGYIALCLLIIAAIVRREAPWPLLAATLTPVGPFGSVIGVELIERRGWGVAQPGIDTSARNHG
jgi:hypothetical protein